MMFRLGGRHAWSVSNRACLCYCIELLHFQVIVQFGSYWELFKARNIVYAKGGLGQRCVIMEGKGFRTKEFHQHGVLMVGRSLHANRIWRM